MVRMETAAQSKGNIMGEPRVGCLHHLPAVGRDREEFISWEMPVSLGIQGFSLEALLRSQTACLCFLGKALPSGKGGCMSSLLPMQSQCGYSCV